MIFIFHTDEMSDDMIITAPFFKNGIDSIKANYETFDELYTDSTIEAYIKKYTILNENVFIYLKKYGVANLYNNYSEVEYYIVDSDCYDKVSEKLKNTLNSYTREFKLRDLIS